MKRNTYTFSVSHNDWSAIIEAHSDHTLYELAETIIKAVKFDFDHAFGFYEPDFFKNTRGSNRSRNDFEQYTLFADLDSEGCSHDDLGVKNVVVDDVFSVGEPFIFYFDYGDDWRFNLVCTQITMGTKLRKHLVIGSTQGTPPVQYAEYEDDDEMDEEESASSGDEAQTADVIPFPKKKK